MIKHEELATRYAETKEVKVGVYYCSNCQIYHDNDSAPCIENEKGNLVCHESEVERSEDKREYPDFDELNHEKRLRKEGDL